MDEIYGKPRKNTIIYPAIGNPFQNTKEKKKRKTLTPAQRVLVWENPKIYGRTCSICGEKIKKLSDLEMDHTRAHSKGGTKLNLAHRLCNRIKSNKGLSQVQTQLGLKTRKHKKNISKPKKKKELIVWDLFK
jgi:5-methylcytosine-specific restriction endonuclease McrA